MSNFYDIFHAGKNSQGRGGENFQICVNFFLAVKYLKTIQFQYPQVRGGAKCQISMKFLHNKISEKISQVRVMQNFKCV